jgi:hypothetical protein
VNAVLGGVRTRLRALPLTRAQALVTAAAIILCADIGILAGASANGMSPLAGMTTEAAGDIVTPFENRLITSRPSPAEAPPAPAAQPVPAPEPAPAVPAPAPAPAKPAEPRIPLVKADPRLASYAGLSTWIDLWDTSLSPERQVDIAAASGVQTIFVQSARFNSPGDIHDPLRLSVAIDRAKDRGLQVMVWYIPDFLDEAKDLRRSLAAITFTTQHGNRADSFGLDIETEKQRNVGERTARLIRLSQRIRHAAGPDYPLSAIVLPPLQLDMRKSWWPGFPWKEIAPFYDVWIPMSYSSFRGTDAETTYRWNLLNIVEMRNRVGNPNLAVHMAGGIADNLPRVDAFVAAVRDGLCLGGGLYDLHTTRPDAWPVLRQMRAEA